LLYRADVADSFVENAFKYGIGIVDKPFIIIKLDIAYHLSFSDKQHKTAVSKDKNPVSINQQKTAEALVSGKHELFMQDNGGIHT
jgi:hypothetical protein